MPHVPPERLPGVQCLADNKTSESKKSKANAFVKHTNESTVERCQAISSHFLIVDEHPKPLQHQIREGVLNRRGEQGQDVLINRKLDHFLHAAGRIHISYAIIDHGL